MKPRTNFVLCGVLAAIELVLVSAAMADPGKTGQAPPPPKAMTDCIMKSGGEMGAVTVEHGPCDLGSDPKPAGNGGGGAGGGGRGEFCQSALAASLAQCRKPVRPTAAEERSYQRCVATAQNSFQTCSSR